MFETLYNHFSGVGTAQRNSSIPPQAIPDRLKNQKWKERMMDVLEGIAIDQVTVNLEFREYYKMVEGRLVYSDFQAPPEITKDIVAIRQEANIPTFLKHYDILGLIINSLVGEYLEFKDKFRVDSVDSISENEFIREKTRKVLAFAKEEFSIELNRLLVDKGINPNQTEFKNEEEKQQYLQMLEQQRQELTPPQIELDMTKNWRTKAAEWAENTLESDQERFTMDELDREEAKDLLLTGRYFRHYRVGYDYYEPENWSPITTFFSQDLDIKNPQDGEYVGRMHFYSASELINKYGDKLTSQEQQRLTGYYDVKATDYGNNNEPSFEKILENHFAETHTVPHEDYYTYQLNMELESAIGAPMATRTYKDKSGKDVTTPSWLPHSFNQNEITNRFASAIRDDINVRKDLIQVTESYFRSYKRIGLLTYKSPEGFLVQDIVTDDILSDFLKENDIKTVKTKTLEEAEESPEENTIVYTYIPEIWKGVKINKGNSYLKKDIYLNVEPLEFQIKGNSNIYDLKLPVVGIIDSPISKKILPYQVAYNVVMNQIYNLLEKEIGMFFLMDINYLPSEFKNMGNTEDMLVQIRNLAKDIGLLPVDMSKQNLKNGSPAMNSLQVQDLSFGNLIQSKLLLAQNYKLMALEQIGITPQRLGTPNKYETAEGVKQNTNASFAQTASIFDKLTQSKKKALELHLSVAQYCQKNNKDISVFYSKSDGDKYFLQFSDENFHLRKLSIIPTTNGKKRKELDNLKQVLLNNNTIGGDILDYAELMSGDTITEIMTIARKSREEKEKQIQVQRQHEQTLIDKQITAQAEENEKDRVADEQSKERDREVRLEAERIEALGDATRGDAEEAGLDRIERAADRAISTNNANREFELKQNKENIENSLNLKKYNIEIEELRQKAEALKLKSKEIDANKYIATINKN